MPERPELSGRWCDFRAVGACDQVRFGDVVAGLGDVVSYGVECVLRTGSDRSITLRHKDVLVADWNARK